MVHCLCVLREINSLLVQMKALAGVKMSFELQKLIHKVTFYIYFRRLLLRARKQDCTVSKTRARGFNELINI